MPTLDEIRRIQEERGIEFYFAQFVDMYAPERETDPRCPPCDDLVSDGAGFAGFAAGEIGQVPADPDGDPRPGELHAGSVAGEPGALRL